MVTFLGRDGHRFVKFITMGQFQIWPMGYYIWAIFDLAHLNFGPYRNRAYVAVGPSLKKSGRATGQAALPIPTLLKEALAFFLPYVVWPSSAHEARAAPRFARARSGWAECYESTFFKEDL